MFLLNGELPFFVVVLFATEIVDLWWRERGGREGGRERMKNLEMKNVAGANSKGISKVFCVS